jgi:hypothetical protein
MAETILRDLNGRQPSSFRVTASHRQAVSADLAADRYEIGGRIKDAPDGASISAIRR